MRAAGSAGPDARWLVPASFAIAFVGALCGIGGGLFAVPLLHFGYRLDLPRAVGTSCALVLASAAGATLAELTRGLGDPVGVLRWGHFLALASGALVGARLGVAASRRIRTRELEWLFAVLLALSAVELLAGGGAPEGAAGTAGGAPERASWTAFGVGLAGGFVAPLFGIGGGLLLVPGQLWLLPQMGFVAARASSLAAAVVSSAVALALHGRDGRVDRVPAACMVLGAAPGAALGARVVYAPGVAELAQLLLGGILVYLALRFGVAAWRHRRRSPQA